MRLIDADELLKKRFGCDKDCQDCDFVRDHDVWCPGQLFGVDVIDVPTIDVELRHGQWIGKPIAGYSNVRCSNCNNVFLENSGNWRYCPACGAKMDEMSE